MQSFTGRSIVNADTDLSFEGGIAKVLYKEMKIPEAYQAIWWEQMKSHKWMKGDPIVELQLKVNYKYVFIVSSLLAIQHSYFL